MNEIELTEENKTSLKKHTKLNLILIILFFSALVLFVGIIPLILIIFGKLAEGYLKRSSLIFCLLFIPFIGIIWKVLKIHRDVKSGKKLRFEIDKFEIIKEKKSTIIIDKINQNKFSLEEYLIPYIKTERPIKIEITKFSKEILFISNGEENYIEKAEKENN